MTLTWDKGRAGLSRWRRRKADDALVGVEPQSMVKYISETGGHRPWSMGRDLGSP